MTMKRRIAVWLMILGMLSVQSIGAGETPQYHPVVPVGTVPEAYVEVVQQNLLGNVPFIKGGLFTYDSDANGNTAVRRLDSRGKTLAACKIDCGELKVSNVIGTSDGGFLIALGLNDREVERGVWLSDSGVMSCVIKCAEDGTVEWVRELPDVTARMLLECYETASGYVFFGERENGRRRRGYNPPTDLSCLTINTAGEFISLRTIGGSGFDSFDRSERTYWGYTIFASISSQDGDFAAFAGRFRGTLSLRLEVNEDFNILSMKETDWQVGSADMIGSVDGQPVVFYRSYPNLGLLRDFDAGNPLLVLDEGDFVLVVSRNITGEYEHTPQIVSAKWYYYETVYSAYTKYGRLLWRAAVDSSPDYDARNQ